MPEQCILNIGNEVTAPTITRNKNLGKMPQIFKPLPTTKAKKKYKRQMPAMLAGKRIPGVLIEAEVESDDDHSQIPIKESTKSYASSYCFKHFTNTICVCFFNDFNNNMAKWFGDGGLVICL